MNIKARSPYLTEATNDEITPHLLQSTSPNSFIIPTLHLHTPMEKKTYNLPSEASKEEDALQKDAVAIMSSAHQWTTDVMSEKGIPSPNGRG